MRAGDADELIREGEVVFARPVARALLRDGRLSWAARGLFSFLWDLPRGWRPRISHLVEMGPDGRDAVRARLKELENVGALRIEPLRAEGGQLAGKRWVLVAPDRWAVAMPLSTEERVSRTSVKPTIGKPEDKVHRGEGSPTKEKAPPTPASADFPALSKALERLIESAQKRNRRSDGGADRGAMAAALVVAATKQLGDELAAAAIDRLCTAGGWPGGAVRELELLAAEVASASASRRHQSSLAAAPPPDPAAKRAGAAFLARIRKKAA